MKQIKYSSIALALSLTIINQASAGEMASPTEFTANTPALATEVNNNFTAAKTAIDDNDNRITASEAAIGPINSAITTNAGNIASNDTDIAANTSTINTLSTTTGTNSGNIDTNTIDIATLKTGIWSMRGSFCRTENPDATYSSMGTCKLANDAGDERFNGYFPVNLPHGVTITESSFITQTPTPASGDNHITCAIYRVSKWVTNASEMVTFIIDNSASTAVQELSEPPDFRPVVDNENYGYTAYCWLNNTDSKGYVYNVTINYEYQ